ncbi:MAG TPA: sigma-70 family RNA polymerase sigma factor [Actinomycetota bacterium]
MEVREDEEREDEERLLTARLLEEVGRRPRLAWVEERELARAVRTGLEAAARLRVDDDPDRRGKLEQLVTRGTEAKHELVTAHLPLVVATAERYASSGIAFLDLFQAGSLGLFEAVERFDWYGSHTFAPVAAWWIRRGICRDVRSWAPGAQAEDPQTAAVDRLMAATDAERLIAASYALPHREREVLVRRQGLDGGPPESLAEVSRRLGISVAEARDAEARAVEALARTSAGGTI